MSRTIRRPPPRSRLRRGYVKRRCWRCCRAVSDCSCPAMDLVVERAELAVIATDIACVFDPPPPEDCECEDCVQAMREAVGDRPWSKEDEEWWPFVKEAERRLTHKPFSVPGFVMPMCIYCGRRAHPGTTCVQRLGGSTLLD